MVLERVAEYQPWDISCTDVSLPSSIMELEFWAKTQQQWLFTEIKTHLLKIDTKKTLLLASCRNLDESPANKAS